MIAESLGLTQAAASAANLVRQVKQDYVALEFIQRRLALSRDETLSVLKELERAGIGRFVVGRRGHPSRLVKITHGTANANNAVEPEADEETYMADEDKTPKQTLLLMRQPPIPITVPADLTPAEAARISKWLELIASEQE